MNWKIVYVDAFIICLRLIHSDLACYWVENIYVRFLFPINKLNGGVEQSLSYYIWLFPYFPEMGKVQSLLTAARSTFSVKEN